MSAPWDITPRQRALYTVIVMTGAFMAILDTTVVDVIVPKLTGPLSTDMYGVQWIITSYMIAAAVALLICEYLIKNYGSKRIFLLGVALFSFASLICGTAGSLEVIIAARIVQGVGEALIMVTSHVMIFSYFPPRMKGLAMGIFALGVSFAPALGPTVGGYLTEYYSWRTVFFINVPIGILLLLAGAVFLPSQQPPLMRGFNFLSFFAIGFATVSLLIMLSQGQKEGWFSSVKIGVLLYMAIAGYLLYALFERNSKRALVDFSLFKNPDFTNGILIYFFVLGFSMYQYFYLLPVYYEHIKMLPTLNAGLAIFAFALFIGIFSPIAGVLSDKIGPKSTLAIATLIYLVTSLFLLPRLEYYTPMVSAVLLTVPFGIGMGMFFAPVTVLILKSAPEEKSELAIVLMDYVRFVGGSFGTALATNNMEYYKAFYFDAMTQLQNGGYVSFFLERTARFLNLTIEEVKEVFRNYELFMSYNYGFYDTFLHAAYWGAIGSLFVAALFILKPKKDTI